MSVANVFQLPWYRELRRDIETVLQALVADSADQPSQLQRELAEIRKSKEGWMTSLADPQLPPTLRADITARYAAATDREQDIEATLHGLQNREDYLSVILDPNVVLEKLNRLDTILAGDNATLANLELSLHIDRIDCFDDGRVALRVCRLGALAECVPLLESEHVEDTTTFDQDQLGGNGPRRISPRRRARLRTDTTAHSNESGDAIADFVADPHRYSGLGEEWFETIEFAVPTEKHWYQLHAQAVAAKRRDDMTHEELAEEFGVTVPTIRKSLRYAKQADPSLADVPSKMPRARWHEEHALEVAAKKAEGLGTNDLVKLFGKSDTTIRKALEHAAKLAPSPGADQR